MQCKARASGCTSCSAHCICSGALLPMASLSDSHLTQATARLHWHFSEHGVVTGQDRGCTIHMFARYAARRRLTTCASKPHTASLAAPCGCLPVIAGVVVLHKAIKPAMELEVFASGAPHQGLAASLCCCGYHTPLPHGGCTTCMHQLWCRAAGMRRSQTQAAF